MVADKENISFQDKINKEKNVPQVQEQGSDINLDNINLDDIDFESPEFQSAFNDELKKMGFSEGFYNEYQKVMGGFADNVTNNMSSSGTVKKVFDASTELMSSEEMMSLIIAINSSDNPNENLIMNNHILTLIFSKKDEGLAKAISYIESLCSNPEYGEKKSYLEKIKESLVSLQSLSLFQKYFTAQEEFNNDTSDEAQAARDLALEEGKKVQEFLSSEPTFKSIMEDIGINNSEKPSPE